MELRELVGSSRRTKVSKDSPHAQSYQGHMQDLQIRLDKTNSWEFRYNV